MIFSYTGLAYLIGFFALGLLTYRFFQHWQREKTTVSKLFFYFTGIFAFFMLIIAIVGLFFVQNTQILRLVAILVTFIQNLAFATIAYLIIYLKFPQISPWWGFIIIFLLGLTTTFLIAITPFRPYLEISGGINWDVQRQLSIGFSRFFLFLITFLPLIVILGQQIKTSKDPLIKAKAFGITLVFIFGLITSLFDFFLETVLKLEATASDITVGFFSLLIFILVFLIKKPPPEEKYVSPPPSFKIPW